MDTLLSKYHLLEYAQQRELLDFLEFLLQKQSTFAHKVEEPEIQLVRKFTAESDAFDFWLSEEEDIYQDYLPKTNPA